MIEKVLSNLWLWLCATAAGAVGVQQLPRIKEMIVMAATDPVGIVSLILFFVGLAGLINAIRLQRALAQRRSEQRHNAALLLEGVERVAAVIAAHGFVESPDTKNALLSAVDELRRARQALERSMR